MYGRLDPSSSRPYTFARSLAAWNETFRSVFRAPAGAISFNQEQE
jgi:hypothetical protein